MTPRYFAGKASDMGHVAALRVGTFKDLVNEVISQPVRLAMTREGFLALPEEQQKQAKRVRYLTACTFTANPAVRIKANAGPCNLIVLDVDNADDASRLLQSDWPTMLNPFAYYVHHTARSTPSKPRLRVYVSAEGIPVEAYPVAVERIAARLGVQVTRESLVVVQPMYLPTHFQHDDRILAVASNPEGDNFTAKDLAEPLPAEEENPLPPPSTPPVADISHLRERLEDVTKDDVQGALDCLDPDCPMMAWIEVAAGIKHQFGEEGYTLWHDWSAKGRKFTTDKDTRYRWDSLRGQTADRAPVTIRSVFRAAKARGWANDRLAKKAFKDTLEWLRSPERSTEEMFDQGAARIARCSTLVGDMEKNVLLKTLCDRLKGRGMQVGMAAIRSDVEKLEFEADKRTMGVPPWVAGLVYVTSGHFFYRPNVDRRFTPEVIDLMYSAPALGESAAPRTSVYLVKQLEIPQVENLRYEPGKPNDRIFMANGVPFINTYRKTYAKADPSQLKAAGEVIEAHAANLILEGPYQAHWLDFFTYLVKHPGVKIRHAPLIMSTKGTGKTWWAELGNAILGASNVMKTAASGLLNNQYNDWAYGHQLLVMEEVRVVGHNRHEVMDKLKPCISDDVIPLNVKYESQRVVPNNTNYVLFTNHYDALAIQDDERRYFVLQSPLQRPEQVLALGPTYFARLYNLLRDNPGGCRAYFEHRTITPTFEPNGRAPETPYKRDLARAAASPLAAAVMAAIADAASPLVQPDIVSVSALRLAVEHSDSLGRFTDQALSSVLRELGWVPSLRCRIEGERHQLWTHGFVGDAVQAARDRMAII